MAVIPYDTSDIRKKLADARANPKTTTDDKTNNDSKKRAEMSDVAKERAKRKAAEETLANVNATIEEKTKAAEDLRKINEQQAAELAEAQKQIAELKPIAEAKKAEDHRRRSLLLENVPKEERKEWQDAPIALLEKYVGKAKAQGGESTDKGGKPDFKKLINESGTDAGMTALNAAVEKYPQAFEEYNKASIQ